MAAPIFTRVGPLTQAVYIFKYMGYTYIICFVGIPVKPPWRRISDKVTIDNGMADNIQIQGVQIKFLGPSQIRI